MRLLDRDAFLALPPGTLFTHYYPARNGFHQSVGTEPQDPFGDLCIKGPTMGNAFTFDHLAVPLSERALNDLDNNYEILIHEAIGASLWLDLESRPHVDDSTTGVRKQPQELRQLMEGGEFRTQEEREAAHKALDSIPFEEPDPDRVIFLAWEAEDMLNLIAQLVPAIRALAGNPEMDEALRSLMTAPAKAE